MKCTLKIIQHNVQHWRTRKENLMAYYQEQNHPDIIFINRHGLKDNESLKIRGYRIVKINSTGEINDGSAICIKDSIKYKVDDDFITDVISVEVGTEIGPVMIATTYLPPRRP